MTDQTTLNIGLPTDKIKAFCRRWGVSEFALFGSVLRADFNEASDIDVLVTFAPGVVYTFKDAARMEAELEAIFGKAVDLVDKQAVQESPNYIRRKSILSSAEVVYAE